MARHIEAWMDGTALSTVGPFIIKGVEESPAETVAYATDKPGIDGQRVTRRLRRELRVVLRVAIRELYDLPRRSYAAEQLAAWASGAVLQLSSKPERQLRVQLDRVPALGDVRDYTQELRVEWVAVSPPYWEDHLPTKLTLTGSDTSGTLTVPGTVPTPLRLTITPGSALTGFTVTAGGKAIELDELGITAETDVVFDRDARDDLRMTGGGVSLTRFRTPESADDLMVSPGLVTVAFEASTSCTVIAEVYGRWK